MDPSNLISENPELTGHVRQFWKHIYITMRWEQDAIVQGARLLYLYSADLQIKNRLDMINFLLATNAKDL